MSEAKAKTPWVAIFLAALMAGGMSAGAAWFINKDKGPAEAAVVEVIKPKDPIYVKVDPFTVNLAAESNTRQRLLHAGLWLRVDDQDTADFLKKHMPQLRSRLLLLAAESTPEQLTTDEGKLALSAKVMKTMEMPFTTPQPVLNITEVLYSEFVIQ